MNDRIKYADVAISLTDTERKSSIRHKAIIYYGNVNWKGPT